MNMKKTYRSLLVAMVAVLPLFTSCSDDNDSNPTLTMPETFVLNEPEFAANNVYDLPGSSSVNLTVNTQPDYGGWPAAVTYAVQLSLDNDAEEEWNEMKDTYTSTKISIPAATLNAAVLDMYRKAHEDADPEGVLPLYIRIRAFLAGTGEHYGEVFSNVIQLNVLSYDTPSDVTLPTAIYVCGQSIDEAWKTWKPLAPVFGRDGRFYTMIYNDADGFKWGYKPEDWFGFDLINEWDNKVEGLEITADSDGNIVFSKAGWYVLEFIAKVVGDKVNVKVVVSEGKACVIGNCVDFGSWTGEEMTAPAGKGEFTFSDWNLGSNEPYELRAYIVCPAEGASDWWRTEFTVVDGKIVWRDQEHNCNDNWLKDVGEEYSIAVAGKTLKVNFDNNTGTVE